MASKMIAGGKHGIEKTLRFMIEGAPSIDPRPDRSLIGVASLFGGGNGSKFRHLSAYRLDPVAVKGRLFG
jgi:hypothetical protein